MSGHRRLAAERRDSAPDRASGADVRVGGVGIRKVTITLRLGEVAADVDAVAAAIDRSSCIELPACTAIAVEVSALPPHHADPFDRVLVAQALTEPLRLSAAERRRATGPDWQTRLAEWRAKVPAPRQRPSAEPEPDAPSATFAREGSAVRRSGASSGRPSMSTDHPLITVTLGGAAGAPACVTCVSASATWWVGSLQA